MKIMIAAGGTGGHIYPALSLADELKKRGHEVVFVGSRSRLESTLIPEAGYPFIAMDITACEGNLVKKAKGLLSVFINYFKAFKITKGYDLVIGFGNYISIPIVLAAKKQGIKTMIHEQNSYVGKANRFLEKKVDLVIASYEESLPQFTNPHTYLIGNPRLSIACQSPKDERLLPELGLDPSKKTVVIFLGSLGSASVAKIIKEYLLNFKDDHQIIYATGKRYYDMFKDIKHPNIRILERIDAIAYMKVADLAVVRAGATTLAEIMGIGIAAVLIPSPYVPNNHQYHNAMALVNKGAGVLLEEKDLSAASLKEKIAELLNDDEKRSAIAAKAHALANVNVLEDIIKRIEELWKQ